MAKLRTASSEDRENFANAIETMKLRMLHALEIFPFISASMLHQAIGTSTQTTLWKPLLAELVEEGKVMETVITAKSPLGRNQTYNIYHLPANNYIYGPK